MELLTSKKMRLPTVYFISDRSELKDIPVGVPFMYGDASSKEHLIRILEYECLYQEALKSGYPFNFKELLRKAGYEGLEKFGYSHPAYLDYKSEETPEGVDFDIEHKKTIVEDSGAFKAFIKDSAVYVDVTKLKELNVFPIWLDKIEEAVHTNIHNYAAYNHNMYNKKLDGMYGGLELVSPNKNLIIIDISGSIPKGVSSTCLALAKNLAETFFADLLITGTKSTLYPYEEIPKLNIDILYDRNGMDNDQLYFKKLVTETERSYKTAIVFGDNHSPCQAWRNEFNQGSRTISREEGKKLCQWKIDKLISFHTNSTKRIAGYADWFEPKEIEHISGWVKYLN